MPCHEVLQDNELVDSGQLFPICMYLLHPDVAKYKLSWYQCEEAKKENAAHTFRFYACTYY